MVAYGLITLIGQRYAIGLWRFVTRHDRHRRSYFADKARQRLLRQSLARQDEPSTG